LVGNGSDNPHSNHAFKTNGTFRASKKLKTKKLFNFASCSQIECEAGGICVEEPLQDDHFHGSPSTFLTTSDSHGQDVVGSPSIWLPAVTSGSSSLLHRLAPNRDRLNQTAAFNSTRKMHRKLRCRCPLGRGGFFCEQRKLSLFALLLYHFSTNVISLFN
jgi:hypothetical protein